MKPFYILSYFFVIWLGAFCYGLNYPIYVDTSVPLHIVKYDHTAVFTAYNLEESQTDGSPCIGSGNHNLCDLQAKGVKVCASRDLPLHTLIDIKGYGTCEVLDRMNARYKGTGRIDILFPDKKSALKFGIKKIDYKIIK